MRRQTRDFFLYLAPYLTDDERARFRNVPRRRLVDALGPTLVDDLVHKVQSNAEFRRDLLADMRHAAWWIRNARWSERPVPVAEAALFWEGLALLGAAGAAVDDLLAFVHCSMSACVCDGCDLDGVRFDGLEPAPLYFGSLWRDVLVAR